MDYVFVIVITALTAGTIGYIIGCDSERAFWMKFDDEMRANSRRVHAEIRAKYWGA